MSEASEKLFYLRVRGRVSGPFNMPALSKMLRRGSVSAVDELSENQIEWTRVSQVPELSPKRTPALIGGSGKRDQVQRQEAFQNPPGGALRNEGSSGSDEPNDKQRGQSRVDETGTLYNYAQRGVMIGPVSESVLRSLAVNGTLRPDDAVWPVGSTNCVEARQLIFLATAFFGANPQKEPDQARLENSIGIAIGVNVEAAMKRSNRRVSRYVLVAAICWVALALFCLHLPFGIADSKVMGWWSFAQSADFPKLATGTIMIVAWHSLACIGIILVASLMRGFARAITLMSIGIALEIPMFVVAAFSATAGWTLFAASMIFIIPIVASGLASLLRARRTAATGAFASAWQGTFAAATAFCVLMVLITIIVVLMTLPDTARMAGVIGFVTLHAFQGPVVNN